MASNVPAWREAGNQLNGWSPELTAAESEEPGKVIKEANIKGE